MVNFMLYLKLHVVIETFIFFALVCFHFLINLSHGVVGSAFPYLMKSMKLLVYSYTYICYIYHIYIYIMHYNLINY